MQLKIVCSGHLVRYPLAGHTWAHLQYLVGLSRLGHQVTFFEDYGWPDSCYDPVRNIMTADPTYGITYLLSCLRPYDLDKSWCYLAEDGVAHGMSRARLAQLCRESDLYVNISNINWIPELETCRRRVLLDTDPVFTQIGAQGLGGPFERYHALFTFGGNVHKPGCDMPTGGGQWQPTRQPVVLNLWPMEPGDRISPFTTISSWSPIGDHIHNGRVYGMKNREFEPYFTLPHDTGERMEMALNAPAEIRMQLAEGGWKLVDPREVTRDLWTYQRYLRASRAEFSVAKHGYVVTRCGWFSERSAVYLASGRPVLIQETGFSDWLNSGAGVIPFSTVDDVLNGIQEINSKYEFHCKSARAVAEEYFDSRKVLSSLVERAMNSTL